MLAPEEEQPGLHGQVSMEVAIDGNSNVFFHLHFDQQSGEYIVVLEPLSIHWLPGDPHTHNIHLLAAF